MLVLDAVLISLQTSQSLTTSNIVKLILGPVWDWLLDCLGFQGNAGLSGMVIVKVLRSIESGLCCERKPRQAAQAKAYSV